MIKLKLKKLREERNLRQHELGTIIHSATSKISKIENGKQELVLSEAVDLAKFLGVPISELYEEKENGTTKNQETR